MADFLFLLARINLATAGAILVVALLRRPMRAAFHAQLAYALWLLVPAAALGSLLPPRVTAAAQSAISYPISLKAPLAMGHALSLWVPHTAPFNWSFLLFVFWLSGTGAMVLIMAWQQRQFHKAERRGMAGPAVTGFLRPRIVIPSGFTAQFSAPEQAAILAHEKAHLARQDARINAVVALLRCLCWFNPLIHVGAAWLRKDQELACDASATRRVSRIDYANALLKSQMRAVELPLGCTWPGTEHPLTERVALLKRRMPTQPRRLTGAALILSLTTLAGVSAWAAQPPQVAPTHNFAGGIVYSQRDDGTGSVSFLTLEAGKQEKSLGVWSSHVTMHFPYGMALADSAIYDFDIHGDAGGKTITLVGHVKLLTAHTGIDGMRGEKLVFDARTGLLDLDGKVVPSGMPKFVACKTDCKFTDQ